MKTKFIWFAVALSSYALLTQSCTTLHAELPASRFESPETNGEQRRFQGQVNLTATQDVTLVPSGFTTPPDFSHPGIDNDTVLGLMASLGLLENLDVGLRTASGPAPYVATAKVQLYGSSASVAKKGDSSLALTGAIGWGTSEKQESLTISGTTSSWNGKVKNSMTDIALILGNRLNDNLLVYGGPFYSNYSLATSIEQTSGTSTTYSSTTGAYQRGANLGFQFFIGPAAYVQLEGVYSDMHAADKSHTALRGAASFGLFF